MLGAIIFVFILVILMPIGILMSFGALAGIMGALTKSSVDANHADSEMLTISESNPWAGPVEVDASE